MEILQPETYSPALLSSTKTLSSTQAIDKRKHGPIPFNLSNMVTPQTMSTHQFLTFDAARLQLGGGVAIYHLASSRVVVCRHPVRDYWFLPKGRRDAGEESGIGAEREGYEEVCCCPIRPTHAICSRPRSSRDIDRYQSGYRNRLLPIAMKHLQPAPHCPESAAGRRSPFSTEPVCTQLIQRTSKSQYLLFWYVAETLPLEVEERVNEQMEAQRTVVNPTPYQVPPRYPAELQLAERIKMWGEDGDPVHHENTGVNADEVLYESHLLTIEEALEVLKGSLMGSVVRSGWEGICLRHEMELGDLANGVL